MADIESTLITEVAASNTAASPDGLPGGSSPLIVYAEGREELAMEKRWWNRANPTVTSGGSANVQTLTYGVAPLLYVRGQPYSFIAGFTNTGTATLNVSGLGAKNIFADNKALAGGEIQAGMVVTVFYDGTQFQIVSTRPLISAPYGFKNVIINGDGQIQQRGAGGSLSFAVPASTPQYTFDRWYFTNGANQASAVGSSSGAFAGSTQSRYSMLIQRNSGQTGTGTMTFQQPLTTDQLSAIVGRIVTLSFSARFGATFITNNSGGLTCTLYMGTGTEGRRGAGFTSETSTCSTTTTSNPSVPVVATSAAVVPTTTTQGCILFSWTPTATAGATDQILITDVQLEVGGVATSFDRRPFDVELARSQRFFQKSFLYGTAPATAAGAAGALNVWVPTGASGNAGATIPLRPTMRTAPTLTTYNTVSANANWRDTTNSADRTVTVAISGDAAISVLAGGTVAGSQNNIHWSAEADL